MFCRAALVSSRRPEESAMAMPIPAFSNTARKRAMLRGGCEVSISTGQRSFRRLRLHCFIDLPMSLRLNLTVNKPDACVFEIRLFRTIITVKTTVKQFTGIVLDLLLQKAFKLRICLAQLLWRCVMLIRKIKCAVIFQSCVYELLRVADRLLFAGLGHLLVDIQNQSERVLWRIAENGFLVAGDITNRQVEKIDFIAQEYFPHGIEKWSELPDRNEILLQNVCVFLR